MCRRRQRKRGGREEGREREREREKCWHIFVYRFWPGATWVIVRLCRCRLLTNRRKLCNGKLSPCREWGGVCGGGEGGGGGMGGCNLLLGLGVLF